jgi:hypothetical protein
LTTGQAKPPAQSGPNASIADETTVNGVILAFLTKHADSYYTVANPELPTVR